MLPLRRPWLRLRPPPSSVAPEGNRSADRPEEHRPWLRAGCGALGGRTARWSPLDRWSIFDRCGRATGCVLLTAVTLAPCRLSSHNVHSRTSVIRSTPLDAHGSSAKMVRSSRSSAAVTASRAMSASSVLAIEPPRMTTPCSSSVSKKHACSFQPACSRIPHQDTQFGPFTVVTAKTAITSPYGLTACVIHLLIMTRESDSSCWSLTFQSGRPRAQPVLVGEDAEDVASETWLRIARGAGSSAVTWTGFEVGRHLRVGPGAGSPGPRAAPTRGPSGCGIGHTGGRAVLGTMSGAVRTCGMARFAPSRAAWRRTRRFRHGTQRKTRSAAGQRGR